MKIFLVSLIPYLIFSIFKTKRSFHMLQQNYYDLDLRYFRWILSNIKKITFESDLLFVVNMFYHLSNDISLDDAYSLASKIDSETALYKIYFK